MIQHLGKQGSPPIMWGQPTVPTMHESLRTSLSYHKPKKKPSTLSCHLIFFSGVWNFGSARRPRWSRPRRKTHFRTLSWALYPVGPDRTGVGPDNPKKVILRTELKRYVQSGNTTSCVQLTDVSCEVSYEAT